MSVSRLGPVVGRSTGKRRKDPGSTLRFGSPFSSKMVVYGHCLVTLPRAIHETLTEMSHIAAHACTRSFWWWQCTVRYKLPLPSSTKPRRPSFSTLLDAPDRTLPVLLIHLIYFVLWYQVLLLLSIYFVSVSGAVIMPSCVEDCMRYTNITSFIHSTSWDFGPRLYHESSTGRYWL